MAGLASYLQGNDGLSPPRLRLRCHIHLVACPALPSPPKVEIRPSSSPNPQRPNQESVHSVQSSPVRPRYLTIALDNCQRASH